jgi:tetratricopeptide (TPR) repeat protein
MLEQGNDNALVRYSVGNAYVGEKKYAEAIPHLQQAIAHEQTYSAAWKLLGRSHYELKQYETAVEVCTRGIEIANAQGDKQAGKEMQVFLRRAERALSADQN